MHKKLQQVLPQMLEDSVGAGNPGVILELDAPTRGIHVRLITGTQNRVGANAADLVDATLTAVLLQS